jgi:hypothetical protein
MNELKNSYTAPVALVLLGAAGLAPRGLQRQALDLLASKATAVMTNVPGPQHALYMAGSHLRRMMFWVPQTGNIGVGISILSYDGGVQFGLVTDKKLCAQPQAIIDRFAPEFENLLYAVLLAPWDEEVDPKLAERSLAATEALAQVAGHLVGDERTSAAPADGQAATSADAVPPVSPAQDDAVPPARLPRRKRSAFAAARAATGE